MTDAIDAALERMDKDEELTDEQRKRLTEAAAEAIRREHEHIKTEAVFGSTMHVHNVPHQPKITTEPLAHLMVAAKKGDDFIILQPRHAGNPFGTMTVGEEEVEAAGNETVYEEYPREIEPYAAVLGVQKKVKHTRIPLTAPLKHSHERGVAVGAREFDPEVVDSSELRCHDCGRELLADIDHTARVLVCPRLYGVRPSDLKPKHDDGAVECGQP